MAANMISDEVLNKKGIELFRELLRVYSVADVDDYYKAGVWRDEVMKADLQLIVAHRNEAGAPDPIPLDEVPEPELPQTAAKAAVVPGLFGVGPVLSGILAAGNARPVGIPVACIPVTALAAARPFTPKAAAPASGPIAELRLIALFVGKWKLDPTLTKMMLAKMIPARRLYVIQNFKLATIGGDSTAALESYIAHCEKTNAWGAATAAGPCGATLAATAPGPYQRVAVPVRPASPAAVAAWPAGGGAGGVRPASASAKAQEKPGELIRSLLQRF